MKKILKAIHFFILGSSAFFIVFIVLRVVKMQSTFSSSLPEYRSVIFYFLFVILYLYVWWFKNYEKIPLRFWETDKKIWHLIRMKFLYFLLFIFEIILTIYLFTSFREIFIQIWAFLVGLLIFFMLYNVRKKIEDALTEIEGKK